MISDEAIETAGKLLGEAASSPARVLVFGSYARGDARADSDVDFLVIERELRHRRREATRLYGALAALPIPAGILLVSEAQCKEPTTATLRDAIREGRLVYEHA